MDHQGDAPRGRARNLQESGDRPAHEHPESLQLDIGTSDLLGEYLPRIAACHKAERIKLLTELAVRLYNQHASMRLKLVRPGHSEDVKAFDAEFEHNFRAFVAVWQPLLTVQLSDKEKGSIETALMGARQKWRAEAFRRAHGLAASATNPSGTLESAAENADHKVFDSAPQSAADVHRESEPAPHSQRDIERLKAERKKLRDAYKAECRKSGVKVTDEMIAEKANPRWRSRDNIQKWLACDPKYDGPADKLIRGVFVRKPHLEKGPHP